jgi:hypothetical protein
MRRSYLFSLAVVVAMFAVSRSAHAFHRYEVFHGASCQVSDPAHQSVLYSDAGITVNTTTNNPALTCPINWSQDSGMPWALAFQKMTASLQWFSAPTGAGGFSPSCMLYVTTTAGSELFATVDHINNPGTPNPTYVFVFATSIALGNVLSSNLYCTNIPMGVGISGYTIDNCFSSALTSC